MEANNLTESAAIVFAGGEMHTVPSPRFDAYVIAADSGYDHALDHGIAVDLLVGDLDSISPESLDHAKQTGVSIERHPPDKDATDLELAFAAAVTRECTSIDLYGGEGGLLSHLIGVASLVTSRLVQGTSVTWHTAAGITRSLVGNAAVSVRGSVGEPLSVVAIADSTGVTISGLTWSLSDENLSRGSSRGLRNTMTGNIASISIRSGAVLVISEGTNTS